MAGLFRTKRLLSLELFRAQAFTVSSCHFTEYLSSSPSRFTSLLDPVVLYDFCGRLMTCIILCSFGLNFYFARESQLRRALAEVKEGAGNDPERTVPDDRETQRLNRGVPAAETEENGGKRTDPERGKKSKSGHGPARGSEPALNPTVGKTAKEAQEEQEQEQEQGKGEPTECQINREEQVVVRRVDARIRRVQLRRGLVFFLLGLLFNACVWEFPANLLDMDILPFFAFAAPVTAAVGTRVGPRYSLCLGVGMMGVHAVTIGGWGTAAGAGADSKGSTLGTTLFGGASSLWVESLGTGEKEFNEVLSNENQECIAKLCGEREENCYAAPGESGAVCGRALDCIYDCDNTLPECFADCLDDAFPAATDDEERSKSGENDGGDAADGGNSNGRRGDNNNNKRKNRSRWGNGEECGPGVRPSAECPEEWTEYYECVLEEGCMARTHFERRRWHTPVIRWIRSVLYEGHFSLLPFMAFPFLGFGLGGTIFRDRSEQGSLRRSKVLGRIAALLSLASGLLLCWEKRRSDLANEGLNWVQVFDERFAQYPFGTGPYLVFASASMFTLLWAFEPLNRIPMPGGKGKGNGDDGDRKSKDGSATIDGGSINNVNRGEKQGDGGKGDQGNPIDVGEDNRGAEAHDGENPAPPLLAVAGWRFVSLFQFMNRYLLTFFFCQGVVIMWPLRLWSHLGGYRDQWELYETKPVHPWAAVALSYAYLASLSPILAVWERKLGSVGTLEWIVRAMSDPPRQREAQRHGKKKEE